MKKFSDRIGITKPPESFQLNSINDNLKYSLWNIFYEIISKDFYGIHEVLVFYYKYYFKKPISDVPNDYNVCFGLIKEIFLNAEWYEVYNFLEFTVKNISKITSSEVYQDTFEMELNIILENELSGYRLINKEFVEITNKDEIESIKRTLEYSNNKELEGIHHHITKSLELLGNKPLPDYLNSIKESISAVEGICKKISGDKSGGIEKALENISSRIEFHTALKKGICHLYGFTSDANGIRHPMLEKNNIDISDARFMLISCSALVNYFIEKSAKGGIIIK